MMQFAYVPSGDNALATSIDLPADDETAGPWPTVIVCHGLTGQRLGRGYHLVEFARRLSAQGIACVRFDQAGCGESTGQFVDLSLPRMARDVEAVRQWSCAQPWCEPDRLGYVGLSLGALPVIAVDAETPAKAIALWAPVYDLPQVFGETAKTGLSAIIEQQGWVPYRGLPIGKAFVDQLGALPAETLLTKGACPLLLFHSEADETVPIRESESYEARCAELGRPCRFERLATANHDFSDYEDRRRVLGRTVSFFAEQLQPECAPALDETRGS